MNKIKLALVATAILVGVGGAFATRPCLQCENSPQYIPSGSGWALVGEYGIDYDCLTTGGTCTYYRPDPFGQPNSYVPCRIGSYLEVNGLK